MARFPTISDKVATASSSKSRLSRRSSFPSGADRVSDDVSPPSKSPDSVKASSRTPLTAYLNKNQVKPAEGSLMLVTVTVLGSPGPLRFLVDKNDKISRVIEMALRVYARQGRLPALNSKSVELYCHNGDFKALDPMQSVGELDTRQFLLYRKKPEEIDYTPSDTPASGPLKHWWNIMSSLVCSH